MSHRARHTETRRQKTTAIYSKKTNRYRITGESRRQLD